MLSTRDAHTANPVSELETGTGQDGTIGLPRPSKGKEPAHGCAIIGGFAA